ncbi:MAG: GNAT family N-acetyltransferase [Acidobacteriota bacterium]|nr:GNAT family N-acetyltransferase [Acidobacteriota bacterium]
MSATSSVGRFTGRLGQTCSGGVVGSGPGCGSHSSGRVVAHSGRWFPGGDVRAASDSSRPIDGEVVGMAASLIVLWDDYSLDTNWRDFTDHGMFTNHDPARGRTLYGAEVMVHREVQGQGIGKHLYAERRALVERLGLLRVRAGARLSGYHRVARKMPPEEYTKRVVTGELSDPTLSFQIKQGFHVIGVARDYLNHDPDSLGNAAVIEWLNAAVATPADYAARDKWDVG